MTITIPLVAKDGAKHSLLVQGPKIISSGGYNNLTNWPYTTNRPQFSGSTLTWIGPVYALGGSYVSGGHPSTANDTQQSLVLTSSGGITTSSDGQIIEGLNISGTVSVQNNNVTIRKCRITVSGQTAYAISLGTLTISGLVVEDCLLDGGKASYEGISNGGSGSVGNNLTVQRNTITGFENLLTVWPWNNSTIVDNYMTQCGNSNNPSYDGDFIEFYTASNITVSHNQFDVANSQLNNVTLNSVLNLTTVGGNDTGISFNNNLISNANIMPHACIDGDISSGGTLSWSFTNNGFYNSGTTNGYSALTHNSVTAPNASPNSGNYTAATQTSTSGTPINGNGQV